MALIEWYLGLHWSARLAVALMLLGASTFLYFVMQRMWIWGWLIGGILLAAAIPERKSKWGDW